MQDARAPLDSYLPALIMPELFLECIMFTLKKSHETAFFAMSTCFTLVFIFFM